MDGDQQGRTRTNFAYAYCHGFLGGPASVKGQALHKTMLEAGVDMSLLNLNGEDSSDMGAITISGALEAVRRFHLDRKSTLGDPDLKLRLVGSSLGGYIVARCGILVKLKSWHAGRRCSHILCGTRHSSSQYMIKWEFIILGAAFSRNLRPRGAAHKFCSQEACFSFRNFTLITESRVS